MTSSKVVEVISSDRTEQYGRTSSPLAKVEGNTLELSSLAPRHAVRDGLLIIRRGGIPPATSNERNLRLRVL
jgi:hypothetical protein